MLRLLTLILLLALGACATQPPKPAMVPYGANGVTFGYESKDLAPDKVEVTYRGDAVAVDAAHPRDDARTQAELDKVRDLALWRAAQIANERGKAGFKVENENRDSDVEVQRRSYYRQSPFYDPFLDPYDDPFWPRYHHPYYYDEWPYRYEQVRTATARAKITMTVTLFQSYDPQVAGMLSTAETLAKLKAARSGAVY